MPEHNLFSIINEASFCGENRQKHHTEKLTSHAFQFWGTNICRVAIPYYPTRKILPSQKEERKKKEKKVRKRHKYNPMETQWNTEFISAPYDISPVCKSQEALTLLFLLLDILFLR